MTTHPTDTSGLVSRDESVRRAYAADASGLELLPDAVARPSTREEVVDVVRQAAAARMAITPAAGMSSMTAGPICDHGLVLSVRGLDRVLDIDRERMTVRVEPGIGMADLKRRLAAEGFLFAPDPTSEEEAALGGSIACNASGARSLKYGATRRHVAGLTVVLASGEVVEYHRSRVEKNTVGYVAVQDPADWFIGSEGTLGVVVEAELSLLPLPERVTGLGFPFPTQSAALAFVRSAREAMRAGRIDPRCLELLDVRSLEIARAQEGGAGWSGEAFIYTEQEHAGDSELDYDAWLALAEPTDALVDDVLVFDDDARIRTARLVRHAVPVTMLERGTAFAADGGRRIATDWAVPYPLLERALAVAREAAERHGVAPPTVYGHAGNGHPHQDFVARNHGDVEVIERVIWETLEQVMAMGGTVAAEHGIGKLKRKWMPLQLSARQQAVMRGIKRVLDPHGLMAPGNILPTDPA
jgi:FAD/FMN-containing dehydrogenase